MNDLIMAEAGLGGQVALVERGFCIRCNKLAGSFRDELSWKEYGISGLCQRCQDIVFDGDVGEMCV